MRLAGNSAAVCQMSDVMWCGVSHSLHFCCLSLQSESHEEQDMVISRHCRSRCIGRLAASLFDVAALQMRELVQQLQEARS